MIAFSVTQHYLIVISITFSVVHIIYAPVILKSHRQEILASAKLDALQKLNLNKVKEPTLLDYYYYYFNFPV